MSNDRLALIIPKCIECGDSMRINKNTFSFIEHGFKQICVYGIAYKEQENKLGIRIPNNCSKCSSKFNYSTGHMFADFKTFACDICIDQFIKWRRKERDKSKEVKCENCKQAIVLFASSSKQALDHTYLAINLSATYISCESQSLQCGKSKQPNFMSGYKYKFRNGIWKMINNFWYLQELSAR